MSNTSNRIKILQALTSENAPPVPFTDDNVIVSDPIDVIGSPEDGGSEWNTKVVITAKPNSVYTGSADIYYRRIDMQVFAGTTSLIQECEFTTDAIIAALNRCHHTEIDLEDIVEIDSTQLPCQRGVIRCLDLVAAQNSLGWYGSVRVPVVIGIPYEAVRLHNLIHHTMPISNYW